MFGSLMAGISTTLKARANLAQIRLVINKDGIIAWIVTQSAEAVSLVLTFI